uniref:proteasome endopeptidase complex n=1 Tax=Phasianus colchicus TaxID=9054 RepID=A0A669PS38_PHACC
KQRVTHRRVEELLGGAGPPGPASSSPAESRALRTPGAAGFGPGGLWSSFQPSSAAPRAFRRHGPKYFIAARRAHQRLLSPNRAEPRPRPTAGHRAEPPQRAAGKAERRNRHFAAPVAAPPQPRSHPRPAARARGRPGSARCAVTEQRGDGGGVGASGPERRIQLRQLRSVRRGVRADGARGWGSGSGSRGPRGSSRCRNSLLEAELGQKGQRLPAARKTGTTIAGVVFKDGVVLGADTRATEGMVVADKNCSKIHYISSNIYCCGAGTAADTEMTTQLIASNLELHALSTGRLPRVVTANQMLKQMLFRYQGYIGAALVLGGVDVTGPHLYSIYPHGSTDKLPYVTMGSGSLAAMAVFEDKYKPDMEEEEAKQLVRDAIAAGIYNDLGSGSNIDICVISKNKLDFIRPYDVANRKGERYGRYKCERGTTAVLTENVAHLEIEVVDETVQTMDTS